MSETTWFENARFGAFIHFGVFSDLARGEWTMNREEISPSEYQKYAEKFNPIHFDADATCKLIAGSGAKYVVFTTMHHEGFRMYNSDISEYNSVKTCGRDFTAEIIKAAKKYGLKIGLYHSLNNWYDQPDAVAALESKTDYDIFINNTLNRIKELISKYNPIDILWYDGWWPFDADGWQAEKMNEMVLELQPHIIFNGRNGLAGDFGTPEGHISAPKPWRPWEACMSLNDHWGFHAGDHKWKSSDDVLDMLTRVANGKGNLLLNIGPKGDGSIPEETIKVFKEVGNWLNKNSEAIFDTDIFEYDLMEKDDKYRGDWIHHGEFTVKDKNMYLQLKYPVAESEMIICGIGQKINNVSLLSTGQQINFVQKDNKLTIQNIDAFKSENRSVIKIECDDISSIYITGGMREPKVRHPHYDPLPSDIVL